MSYPAALPGSRIQIARRAENRRQIQDRRSFTAKTYNRGWIQRYPVGSCTCCRCPISS